MMECRALFFVVFLSLCINQVTSLTCYECNSATDADRDACFAGNATEMTCTSYQDTCVIILTKILLPNNGPQDRKSDNEELSQITRTCGNKAGFDHLAKIDKRCTVEAIGEFMKCVVCVGL
ncbi:hypothetical protein EB796_006164 [Bugula neritina]|uniref:Protein sleepless n=1 Tax=Bugula neritina TaxID=10212 RepID=A0A7J7KCE8_BUGNE|nr:hypothetical protein EB796_006164 [Bugula neritina]